MFTSVLTNNWTRFRFIETLADELVSSHLNRRFEMPTIQRQLKQLIGSILDIPENTANEQEGKLEIRKYCHIYPSKLRRLHIYALSVKSPFACSVRERSVKIVPDGSETDIFFLSLLVVCRFCVESIFCYLFTFFI